MGQSRNVKPVERRPSGIAQHRWKDNTKMNLRENGGDRVDCIDSAEGQGKDCCRQDNEFSVSIEYGKFLD